MTMANRKTGRNGVWRQSAAAVGKTAKGRKPGKAGKRSASARMVTAQTRRSATSRKSAKARKRTHAPKPASRVVREPGTVVGVSTGSGKTAVSMSVLVERSSLGTPLAQRIRSYTSDENAERILRRASQISHQTGQQREG